MYSQQNEEQLIKDYFKDERGILLSIGENDGKTLSNVYAALDRGWSGTLIEPSLLAFPKLERLWKDRPDLQLLNLAVSNKNGRVEFFESGSHLSEDDSALLSTLMESELGRWDKRNFLKVEVMAYDFPTIMKCSRYKKFDLISIDAEGMDWEILKQMDLKELGCRMLIVEHNGLEQEKYIDYAVKHGLVLYSMNSCNLIFIK